MQFKAHNITLTCLILIVMISLTKSQQIIPEINTTLFYEFNTPGRWYLSMFSSPYDDMTVNTVSFIQSQTLEG